MPYSKSSLQKRAYGKQQDFSAHTSPIRSLPAVPALQKAAPEEELQMKADPIQKAAPEEELQMKVAPIQKAAPEEELQMKKNPFQLKSVLQKAAPEEELQMKTATVQKQENKTGMPDNLKSGVENLSGMDLSDVKVHYNSSQPAQLNALAYAQGTDIHIAPGQEQHLPHEAWHVAQQKQGRVQPTTQMKEGVPVNDDPGLEHEADVMGAKANQTMASWLTLRQYITSSISSASHANSLKAKRSGKSLAAVPALKSNKPVQRYIMRKPPTEEYSINLSSTVLNYTDFGITPVSLNHVEFPGGNADEAVVPVGFRSGKTPNSVRVSEEPVNVVSCRVVLPTDPPWLAQSTLGYLASRIQGTGEGFEISDHILGEEQKQEGGQTEKANAGAPATLQVGGFPNDVTFKQLVKQHEYHHVKDLELATKAILEPWDNAIHSANVKEKEFQGNSEEEAMQNFYAFAGGTPKEIGERFKNRLRDMGRHYHNQAEGKMPSIDNVVTLGTPQTGYIVRVYYKHPMG